MSTKKSPALGKGLEALLGAGVNIDSNNKTGVKTHSVTAEIAYLDLKDIVPNPDQPRKEFNEETLQELCQSIKEHGVITPITVNKHGDKYTIIAGERRYRASKMAGLDRIPAYIRIVTVQETMEMSLIENIQREDLNSIEIALSLQALLEQSQLSQEQLGKKIGKTNSTISNYIRLLKLPAEVQLALRNDTISMGHARCIISVSDEAKQVELVRRIIAEGLSVRQVETIVARLKQENAPKIATKRKTNLLPETHSSVQSSLSQRLSANVLITRTQRGKGTISIPFTNDKDFERICALLDKQ